MARSHRKRLVIDTNWYISATINRASRRSLYTLLSDPLYTVLCCHELIEEYSTVIRRNKFEKYVKLEQAFRFVELILPVLAFVDIKSHVTVSRDINDNYLLALCKDGHADYLITGDPDLLVLKSYGKTTILTMKEFMEFNR